MPDTLTVSACRILRHTPQSSQTFVGIFMAKIDLRSVAPEDLDEAIHHLHESAKNTHNLQFARWCAEEIDRMLDAKLELSR